MYVVHRAFDIHNAPRRCKSRKSPSSFSPLLSARLFTCLYERFSLSRALLPLLRLIMTMMMLSFFYCLSPTHPPPFFSFFLSIAARELCRSVCRIPPCWVQRVSGTGVTQEVHFAHIQVWTETQSQHEGIQVKGPVSHGPPL